MPFLSLCISNLLTYIISFYLKNFFNNSCKASLVMMNFLNFCCSKKVFISSPLLKEHFTDYRIIDWRNFLKILFICLFLEIGEGRERDKERNIYVTEKHQSVASHVLPSWGPGSQPKHMPWLEIEPVTFQFTDQHSIHWATVDRARLKDIWSTL